MAALYDSFTFTNGGGTLSKHSNDQFGRIFAPRSSYELRVTSYMNIGRVEKWIRKKGLAYSKHANKRTIDDDDDDDDICSAERIRSTYYIIIIMYLRYTVTVRQYVRVERVV